ncbi:MAG: hypothetical protein ACLRXC_13265 [[Clostridium] leptum]
MGGLRLQHLSWCKQPHQYELHPFRYRQNHHWQQHLIGPDVRNLYCRSPCFGGSAHLYREAGKRAIRTQTAPVTIGNNVWIGGGTIILPGVTVGDNASSGQEALLQNRFPQTPSPAATLYNKENIDGI